MAAIVEKAFDKMCGAAGVDAMPLTLFYIKWKMPKGDYFIRLCPRDSKGDRGTTSNMLRITIY